MKIYIVGIVASGKTTLAKRWTKKFNIPFYELDAIVYQQTDAGRVKRTAKEQQEVIKNIDKNDDWIIEGTYRESCHCLMDLAEKIIFLDTPLWKRKIRILIRYFKQVCGIEKCHYKPSLEMLKCMYQWTREFEENREEFEAMLSAYSEKVTVLYTKPKRKTERSFLQEG